MCCSNKNHINSYLPQSGKDHKCLHLEQHRKPGFSTMGNVHKIESCLTIEPHRRVLLALKLSMINEKDIYGWELCSRSRFKTKLLFLIPLNWLDSKN